MRIALGVLMLLSACSEPSSLVRDAGQSGLIDGCIVLPNFDFGEVKTLGRRDLTVPIDTPGRQEFTIENLPPPFSLLVTRSTTTITFVFSFAPPDSRLHVADVSFTGGPGCAPQLIQLSGTGSGEVLVTPVVDFGMIPLNQPTTRNAIITNSRRSAVDVTIISTAQFTAPGYVNLAPLEARVLPITVTPTARGTLSGAIALRVSSGETLSIETIAQGGRPTARLEPRILTLPFVPVVSDQREGIQRTVRIFNDGDGDLQISPETQTNAVDFSLSNVGAFVSPNARSEFILVFAPELAGPRMWEALITTNDPQNPTLKVQILAEAKQIAPCALQVTIAPTGFSTTSYPATQSVTFSNPNANECLVDALAFVGVPMGFPFEADQFLVPAGGTFTRELVIPRASTGVVRFKTFGTGGFTQSTVTAQ